MKKNKGFNTGGVIAAVAVAVLLIIATIIINKANSESPNFKEYDFNTIIEPSDDNGQIGDNVKGDKNAPVLIFEYADFQCGYCARMNIWLNDLIKELDGKLAIVYRSYILSYHQNGTAAASAAEAAGLQGYWKPYADKLFNEQAEWSEASASERTELFDKYFTEVTKGKGDLEKFNSDLASKQVSDKISFDMGIGKRLGTITGTPSLFIDGKLIDFGNKNGSSITVNGETFSWDEPVSSTEDFKQLIKDIVKAKLK